jgi:iron complex transport system ATP-binding protein
MINSISPSKYLQICGLKKTWHINQASDKSYRSGIYFAELNVEKGERIVVLGPSGSGKSTFLKLLAKDIDPNLGEIYFLDKLMVDWSYQELSFYRAVLPQAQEIGFDFSVDLIVGLGCLNQKNISELEVKKIIKNSLSSAMASHLAGRQYMTLSGGEKARVQLARIFAQMQNMREGLLLVDEPFAALDPYLQIALLSNLCDFAKQRALTVIAILHDVNHALHYFDRVIFIKEGLMNFDQPMNKVNRIDLENLYGIKFLELKTNDGESYFFPEGAIDYVDRLRE